MESIKIVRLKEGCDIITTIDLIKGEYLVKDPMIVDLHYRKGAPKPELVLTNWLPVAIIQKNEACISVDEVLCILDPNEHLAEYYKNLAERTAEYLTSGTVEETTEEELEELAAVLQELEINKGTLIH